MGRRKWYNLFMRGVCLWGWVGGGVCFFFGRGGEVDIFWYLVELSPFLSPAKQRNNENNQTITQETSFKVYQSSHKPKRKHAASVKPEESIKSWQNEETCFQKHSLCAYVSPMFSYFDTFFPRSFCSDGRKISCFCMAWNHGKTKKQLWKDVSGDAFPRFDLVENVIYVVLCISGGLILIYGLKFFKPVSFLFFCCFRL